MMITFEWLSVMMNTMHYLRIWIIKVLAQGETIFDNKITCPTRQMLLTVTLIVAAAVWIWHLLLIRVNAIACLSLEKDCGEEI
jgi:hypothetical protein